MLSAAKRITIELSPIWKLNPMVYHVNEFDDEYNLIDSWDTEKDTELADLTYLLRYGHKCNKYEIWENDRLIITTAADK